MGATGALLLYELTEFFLFTMHSRQELYHYPTTPLRPSELELCRSSPWLQTTLWQ